MARLKRKTVYALVQISVPVGTVFTGADLAREVKNSARGNVESMAVDYAWRSGTNPSGVTTLRARSLTKAQVTSLGLVRE